VNGNCYCKKVISQVRSSDSDDSSDNHNTSTVDNSSGSKSGSDSSNGSKSSSGGGANSSSGGGANNSSGGGANNSSVSVVGRHFDATRPAAAATLLSSTPHPKRGNKGKTISLQAGGRVSMTGCFLNAERHLQPCRLPCCLKKRKNNQPVALVAVFLCWERCFDAIHPCGQPAYENAMMTNPTQQLPSDCSAENFHRENSVSEVFY